MNAFSKAIHYLCIISIVLLFSCKKEKPIEISYTQLSVNENVNVQSLMFVNSFRGFACGGLKGQVGSIYKTTDGGASWNKIFSVANNCLYDVAFYNDSLGFACGENLTLFKTIDGGVTWVNQQSVQGQPTPSYICTLRKIYIVSSTIVYVAGGSNFQTGITYKTFDNGGYWIYNTFDTELRGMYFKDKYTGYFSGYGAIYHTADSANSFNRLVIDDDYFTSISFPNYQIGYACGYNGGIYRTSNEGNSWDEQLHNNTDINRSRHFNKIHFADVNEGYAVGNNGLIIFTTDGGGDWNAIKKVTEDDLFSVYVQNKQRVFVTSTQGKIFLLNP